MATNQIGIRNSNVFVPYTAATKRTKALDISSYIGAGANASNITNRIAWATFYADSNGQWFMDASIDYTADLATDSYHVVTVSGITFKNITNYKQEIGAFVDDATYSVSNVSAIALYNSSSIYVLYGATSVTGENGKPVFLNMSGILLESEPTWASLGTTASAALEGALPVDVYIPSATTGVSGLVDNSSGNTDGTPIKGRTNGVAVGAGYVGETIVQTNSITVTTSWSTGTAVPVPAGKYIVYAISSGGSGTGRTSMSVGFSTDSGANSFSDQLSGYNVMTYAIGSDSRGSGMCVGFITLTSTTNYYLKTLAFGASCDAATAHLLVFHRVA